MKIQNFCRLFVYKYGGGDEERACNNTTDAEQIDFCVVVLANFEASISLAVDLCIVIVHVKQLSR